MSRCPLPVSDALWQSSFNWQPTIQQQQQFQQLYDLVLTGNQKQNLTRITAANEFWEKHLWDSLSGIKPWLQVDQVTKTDQATSFNVIDIGTGAGFPGLPIAIVQPSWHLTLLDATRKKITFIEAAVAELGLSNVAVLCDRAESMGQHPHHRELYDLACVRAVAAVTVCAEYALPLVKLGGLVVMYRGQWSEAEAIALKAVLPKLGGVLQSVELLTTPMEQGVRHCLYLKKEAVTPRTYPRMVGVPMHKPL
jgi:16S rRNA (guanine527-N7)-methyltransferase